MNELTQRFMQSSRGRNVRVTLLADSLLGADYHVRFDDSTNLYEVSLRHGGCFEGAYRFLERWIARHASIRDGVYVAPPADYLDLSTEPYFWMIERRAEQLLSDMALAIEQFCSGTLHDAPELQGRGEIALNERARALRGLDDYFHAAKDEIRRAILSPPTIHMLQSAKILPADIADASSITKT